MLLNPNVDKDKLKTYAGTRILRNDLNLLQKELKDPENTLRVWRIVGVYAPVRGRAVVGIRVKVVDKQGIVSFVEQMQLEVLLGLVTPGTQCRWSGKTYQPAVHQLFHAFVMDDDDCMDDLLDREHILRAQYPDGVIPDQTGLIRQYQEEPGLMYRDTLELLTDGDVSTGMRPDYRLETISKRWLRQNRERLRDENS